MPSGEIAPSNILNFAITLDRLSSKEHVAHLSINLGGIRTAYASGIRLRQLARNMNLAAGTVLARSKREGWTQQIAQAKLIERPELARDLTKSNATTPMQSAAITMQERAARYTERMAGVSEKVLPHLESMQPGAILDSARNIGQLDRVARRNCGLENQPPPGGVLNLAILTNQAAVQVVSKT